MSDSPVGVRDTGRVLVVDFRTNSILDTLTVESIGESLYALVRSDRRRPIVLDFDNVHFVSSPALSMLLTLRRKADSLGIPVALCRVRPDVLRLFRITRLDKLFRVFATDSDAEAQLAPQSADKSS